LQYSIHHHKAAPIAGRLKSARATSWTYHVTRPNDNVACIITLSTDLLDSEVRDDVFPVKCIGQPEIGASQNLDGIQSRGFSVNRVTLSLSDGSKLRMPSSCYVTIRLPTTAERTRFFPVPVTPTGGESLGNTAATDALVHQAEALMKNDKITRPTCQRVVKAMVGMGAVSLATARLEKDILAKSCSRSSSINGLFGNHSGTEPRYSEFRKRHIKNSRMRDKKYYFDLSPAQQ